MDSPIDLLVLIPDRPLGTVVHIGAGATDLSSYSGLHARRLVMVEGDADAAQALKAVVAPHVGQWQILDKPVAAAAGPLTWHRHNLPSLDGPLDASRLVQHYPRLRRTASESVQAISIGELLASLRLQSGDHDGSHVLVLDVPGQEMALLESLDRATLRAFGWVAVRGRGPTLANGADGIAHVAAWMDGANFEHVPTEGDGGGLWPIALFRLSRSRLDREATAERDALAARVAHLERELRSAHDELATASTLTERQARDVASVNQARNRAEQATAELHRKLEETVAERDQQATELQSLKVRTEALGTDVTRLAGELAGAQATVARLRTELQTTATERDEQAHWHQENAKWAKSLSADNERLTLEIEKTRSELAALCDNNAALQQQLEAGRADREAAERKASDLAARQQLLDAEILKAEAQLELVKDVLLREKNF